MPPRSPLAGVDGLFHLVEAHPVLTQGSTYAVRTGTVGLLHFLVHGSDTTKPGLSHPVDLEVYLLVLQGPGRVSSNRGWDRPGLPSSSF